ESISRVCAICLCSAGMDIEATDANSSAGRRGVARPRDKDLKQEFENLDVPARLVEIATPGIETVTTHQESMSRSFLAEAYLHRPRQHRHVLTVIEDGNRDACVMGRHTGEAFEHLVACD